jgi:hypothetical protein
VTVTTTACTEPSFVAGWHGDSIRRGEGRAAGSATAKTAESPRKEKDLESPRIENDDQQAAILRELERMALSEANSGRAALAKVTAAKALLSRRERHELSEAEKHLWDPSRDEREQVDEEDWYPPAAASFKALDWQDTVGKRRKWWITLHKGRR